MKKLTNKKGFTLIEMLVVIAIIAVLVAIIIPVVTNSTTKAAAAANAANLRAIKAEATTDLLNDQADDKGYVHYAKGSGTQNGTFTVTDSAPKAKACGKCVENTKATVEIDPTTGNVNVTYGTNTIEMFATVADTGNADSIAETTVGK